MRALLIGLLVVALGGCATPMGQLQGPPKWCMSRPGNLPVLKEGDDLVPKYASLRRKTGRYSSRLRCLQRYSRAVSQGLK